MNRKWMIEFKTADGGISPPVLFEGTEKQALEYALAQEFLVFFLRDKDGFVARKYTGSSPEFRMEEVEYHA